MSKDSLKLHLGCGTKILDGWTNVDIYCKDSNIVNDDVTKLSLFKDNSVDVIYTSHVLEHVSRHAYKDVLKLWYSKLKPKGVLRIAVPDFEKICNHYLKFKNIPKLIGLTMGGQRNHYDFHGMIFDESLLRSSLEEAGFIDVSKYDWRNTEHSHVDDYSQSYLPHMDKVNGTLMSLNLEARKSNHV
jgi:predicted SAM-dependent methyltransferase